MRTPARAIVLAFLGLVGAACPAGAAAQRVGAALPSDSARVGDVVPVAIRVVVEPGQRVLLPDTLPLGAAGDSVENAARLRERVDTLADGSLQVTGVYAVTPWRTGELSLPPVPVQVVSGDESVRTLSAQVPPLTVVTVLPPDTAGIQPRPPKGVIGASWDWRILGILLAILLALLGLLLWWWWRRRGGDALELRPATPPRDVALATLQRAREGGYIERGEWKDFYTLTSEAVRRYAASQGSGWGEDLTTTELLDRLGAQAGERERAALERILREADQVKFARRMPTADEALAEWEAARAWVQRFSWPPQVMAVTESEVAA